LGKMHYKNNTLIVVNRVAIAKCNKLNQLLNLNQLVFILIIETKDWRNVLFVGGRIIL